jgi:hypothetical protein
MAEVNTEEWMEKIHFINERERELFAAARFGESVRDFLVSEVGRFLHGRAKLAVEECKDKMLTLNPNEADFDKRFRNLKDEAWAAEHFMQWLVDAINDAEMAAQNLDEEDLLT